MADQSITVPLTQGYVALIDVEDYEQVSLRKWHVTGHDDHRYAMTGKGAKRVSMHRMLVNAKQGEKVDHRNGDGLDNRRVNLRICTHAQNMMNRKTHKSNKSGHRGVLQKPGRYGWYAQIKHDGKTRHIGYYPTFTAAVAAYEAEAARVFGEFKRQ